LKVLGKAETTVRVDDKNYEHLFHIMDTEMHKTLIGLDFLRKYQWHIFQSGYYVLKDRMLVSMDQLRKRPKVNSKSVYVQANVFLEKRMKIYNFSYLS